MRIDDPARPRDPLAGSRPALMLQGGRLGPLPALDFYYAGPAHGWRVHAYVLVGPSSFRHHECQTDYPLELLNEYILDPEETLRTRFACTLDYDRPAGAGLDINPEDLGL